MEEKMKKIFIIVLIMSFCICTACNNGKEEQTVKYQTGIFYDKNWEETVGTYNGDVIPDEQTAVSVATQIFNAMEKESYTDQFIAKSVFYDEQDSIWIVSFWEKSNEMTLGNDCNIAMQKKDGKVLRIWFGE